MLSSTWQMSSHMDKAKFTQDGDNRLLWRMNPQRLEIEAWRDTLLAVTGELDRKQGGPPINEILESKRRTLYATISRTGDVFQSDGFLRLFDFPAAVSSSEKRTTSTVPQQYLFMLNSEFMKQRARTLGTQLYSMQGELAQKISQTYRRLYSRPPENSELELAKQWLGESATQEQWQRYAQVLLSAHELMQLQ